LKYSSHGKGSVASTIQETLDHIQLVLISDESNRRINRKLNEESKAIFKTATTHISNLINELQQIKQTRNQMEQQCMMQILESQENRWATIIRMKQETEEKRTKEHEKIQEKLENLIQMDGEQHQNIYQEIKITQQENQEQMKTIIQETKISEEHILKGELQLMGKIYKQEESQENHFKLISQGIDTIYQENAKGNNMLEVIGKMINSNEEGLHHIDRKER
jgi:hypothetical protein